MTESAVSPLVAWQNFYVIVGSAAAALTGLQFVVIALGAENRALGGHHTIRAFGTPTILHFCAVLLISAILTAPWPRPAHAGVALAVCAMGGLAVVVLAIRAARRQTAYRPVLEDWLWHFAFPAASYTAILVAALVLGRHPGPALFAIGGAAIFLLFTAIHNAWDAVTYLAVKNQQGREEPQNKS